MQLNFHVVNVFSENRIYGGNQLGVFPKANNLSINQMQTIAKQLNYSESTFITRIEGNQSDVRIFLPENEIPFAGHPIIGTSYILEKNYRQSHDEIREEIILNLKGGQVSTRIYSKDKLEIDLVYMDQLEPKLFGEFDQIKDLLNALNLEENDLIENYRIFIIAPSDLKFIFIPVKDPHKVNQIKPNIQALLNLLEGKGMDPYVFSPNGLDGGQIRARFFAPNHGIDEDPATGSAQASLIHALSELDLLNERKEIVVEQGYSMGRPSKLHNKITYRNNKPLVKTGGRCHHVISGDFYL